MRYKQETIADSETCENLCDRVTALNQGKCSTLLNRRRLLETISENAAKQILTETHVIKVLANLKSTEI